MVQQGIRSHSLGTRELAATFLARATMFLEAKLFRRWLVMALAVWLALFVLFVDLRAFAANWYYPAVMVLGAFVAGSTPEGGGAVAFPVLNVFLEIPREHARDFSLMIQSVGMTSASLFILTNRRTEVAAFRPLLWSVPVACAGFVLGMLTVQGLRVTIVQALFLAMIASFAVAYGISACRGEKDHLRVRSPGDWLSMVAILLLGGVAASLFGTGSDILIYTLAVTRFHVKERLATELSVVLMAAVSLFGFCYRGVVERDLTHGQVQAWLCAYPVVLIMAPLGALVLKHIDKELLLRAVIVLNVAQLAYFLLVKPSAEKTAWGLGATAVMTAGFLGVMTVLARRRGSGPAGGCSPVA